MRYLSLFSGLGGAELAFAPLGWECVAVSEIDPAACRVLSFHYPTIPNLGDITAITEGQIKALGKIDLVIFGFPCQDLSVAGKRAGLKDKDGENTRSGLFFDAMRVVRWSGARWAVAENVPGLFSSEQGRDFAAVVGEMAGVCVDVPDGGWRNAGVLAGPDGLVEWAVLDAKFFRVAQRRRRVFLVRDTGDWTNRQPVLLERESVCRDFEASRQKRERIAGTVKGGSGERGWPDPSDGNGGGLVDVAGTLGGGSGERGWQHHDGAGAFVPIAHTLGTRNTDGRNERGDGSGNLIPTWPAAVASTLDAHFGDKWGLEDQHINSGASHFVPSVVGTMACNTGPNGHDAGNFQSNQGVDSGYVIPVGREDTYPCLRTQPYNNSDPGMEASMLIPVAQPMCIKGAAIGRKPEAGPQYGEVLTDGSSYTLNASETHGVLAFTQNSRDEVRVIGEEGEVSGSLSAETGTHQTTYLAFARMAQGGAGWAPQSCPVSEDCALPLDTKRAQSIAYEPVGFIHPRQLRNSQSSNQIGIKPEADISDALTSEGPGAVSFHTANSNMQGPIYKEETMWTVEPNPTRHAVNTGMQVRRLTPVECERLQGIPDNFTKITDKSADGPRYRMIGNGFAVPCLAWIGRRIQMVEDMLK